MIPGLIAEYCRGPSVGTIPVDSPPIKKTALNSIHQQLGARMTHFAGWELPVQYRGIIPEHMAVRTNAGLFDVSHMGELEIKGPNAQDTIQRVTCNDINRLAISQCQYSALTTPEGTFVDDILIYRLDTNHFFLCVNASNQEKDYQWICSHALSNTEVIFRSEEYSQLAIQGPKTIAILQLLTLINLEAIRPFWFSKGMFAGAEVLISRTGYTGEDGFEIYCNPGKVEMIWTRILESGRRHGLEPIGLAARNTLRLEAGLLLCGNDMDENTTVFEAGLSRICKLQKGYFIGRDALIQQQKSGVSRILLGFEMMDRAIARDGYLATANRHPIGSITSGSPAPFIKKNIGFARLPAEYRSTGTEFGIIIREKEFRAQVVPTPFYKGMRQNGKP
jgi:aminomethyltransferase